MLNNAGAEFPVIFHQPFGTCIGIIYRDAQGFKDFAGGRFAAANTTGYSNMKHYGAFERNLLFLWPNRCMAKFRTNHQATGKGTSLKAGLLLIIFLGILWAIWRTFSH